MIVDGFYQAIAAHMVLDINIRPTDGGWLVTVTDTRGEHAVTHGDVAEALRRALNESAVS